MSARWAHVVVIAMFWITAALIGYLAPTRLAPELALPIVIVTGAACGPATLAMIKRRRRILLARARVMTLNLYGLVRRDVN